MKKRMMSALIGAACISISGDGVVGDTAAGSGADAAGNVDGSTDTAVEVIKTV
jgi:hypothetical protein